MATNSVLFEGNDTTGNAGLWITDGTAAGTHELAVISDAGPGGGFFPNGLLGALNGQVLFNGVNSSGIYGLWVSDGTAAGTHELTGISGANAGGILGGGGATDSFTVFNGQMLFAGENSNGQFGLWVSDGTAVGTHELTGILGANFQYGVAPQDLTIFNGNVLFGGLGANGQEGLWVTDGTAAGTRELTGISGVSSVGLHPSNITAFNGEALFAGLDANFNFGLWVTDGTATGTHELAGITGANAAGLFHVSPGPGGPGLTVFNGKVLFNGTDAAGKLGLWASDGTAAGTHELTGISGANGGGIWPTNMVVFKGAVLFNGRDANGNFGLWVTDGTATGTHELTGISGANSGGLNPLDIMVFNGNVLFDGTDAAGNLGLWVSDGTAAGTYELTGITGASDYLRPTNLTPFEVAVTNRPPAIDTAHSIISGTINERPNVTGSLALDIANGAIAFTDADLNDRPTATVTHQPVTWQDSQGHAFQLTGSHVATFDTGFLIVPEAGNTNTGKIDWGYTIADSALDFLGVGETVVVTSTVEIDDGHGGKVDQGVTVTINGADDTPIALADFGTVKKGAAASGNVLANDRDPDAHDVLHVASVSFGGISKTVGLSSSVIDGTYGTLTIALDGTYQYVAHQGLGSASKNGGLDTFTYTVNGGHVGDDASATVTINVLGTSVSSGITQGGSLATDLAAADSEIKGLISQGVPDSTAFHLTDRIDPTLVAKIVADVAQQFSSQGNYVTNAQGYVNPGSLSASSASYDQCVALVWGVDNFVFIKTANWSPGQPVLNGGLNAQFPPGTAVPIATFVDGHYTSEHAAIFLGYGTEDNKAGFFMLDQYLTQPGSAGQPSIQGEPAEIRFYTFADHAVATEYYSILV